MTSLKEVFMPWPALLSCTQRLPVQPLDEWFASLQGQLGDLAPWQLAVRGGRLAATPGLAFLAGYQAALRVLWPSAPSGLGALCVTENNSTRPADMHTRLHGLTVSGRKDFVTAAEAADWLLVAARDETDGAPVHLSLAVVYRGAPGVRIEPLPSLSLMPDIGHARLLLEQAHCELLAGDGWDAYVKPFRSIEDLHVLAAISAWLYGVGQDSGWPQTLQLRLLALLAGCAELTRQCPRAASSHVLLAGLFAQFDALRSELDAAMAAGPAPWAQFWQRDQNLLNIAASARRARLQKALLSVH
jgi:hypothetical protein